MPCAPDYDVHEPYEALDRLVLGSWGNAMRDAVRNKGRWKGAVRIPKILVLTGKAKGREGFPFSVCMLEG